MNWGTIAHRILSQAGQPVNQLDKVKLALIDALSHHRHDQLYFNQLFFFFNTVDGTPNYGEATSGFPKELIEIVGEYLFLDVNGVAGNRQPIERRTMEELELSRVGGTGDEGQPEIWAYSEREIHFHPTPDASTHIISGRAYVDQWVPIPLWVGGTWKFYKPLTTTFDASAELDDDYPTSPDTNPWLTEDHASAMLRHYAEYLLWSQTWQAEDQQDQKALLAYTQARYSLEERSSSLGGPLQVEPYPIGPFA